MDLFLIIVIVLFALAITDLVVGVSNDAVNFLNSAIGAKAAKFRNLMIITTIGIILGAILSGGMMEVARKGIFHPEHFYFDEIMFMFLAVMLTDIILLDTFNTLGLPTSTTVSIVFELLGAAVGMSIIKISNSAESLPLGEYINTEKAMAIIFGILLSVFIAFIVGALIQYLSRLLFSFNLSKRLKYFGSAFGGIALTAITYFLLIKGVKNAPFMTDTFKEWVATHTLIIMGGSFVFWTIVMQLLHSFFKIDILRLVVLIGTMALAMAFASNDLVNFIGVPIAGLDSFINFSNSGSGDPSAFSMVNLSKPVETKTYLLLIAGIIMAVTLWLSKKARSVVKTSVDLSRQDEGEERFGSSSLARGLVRGSINISKAFSKISSPRLKEKISKQFEKKSENDDLPPEKRPAFDMLRAAVNLIVASILISIGTSLKLPLSTTYVTFMVAMGTSLADRAWGRESAVYRITGVLSVIGGWFLTALSAFTLSFIVLNILNFGGFVAVIIMAILAAFFIYKTYQSHRSKQEKREKETALYKGEKSFKQECKNNIASNIIIISDYYIKTISDISSSDRKSMKKNMKTIISIDKQTKTLKNNIYKSVQRFEDSKIENGVFYVQIINNIREAASSLKFLAQPSLDHLENKHKELTKLQVNDLKVLATEFKEFKNKALELIEEERHENIDDLKELQYKFIELTDELKKNQLKRIKKKKDPTKASVLFINILQESKIMAFSIVGAMKAYKDFLKNY